MSDLVNYRIKIITQDGRNFIGKLLSFDKYLNLVLSECEEFRITKKSQQLLNKQLKNIINGKKIDENVIQQDKRYLGLIILRGEQVVSLSIDSGSISKPVLKTKNLIKPKGIAKPITSNNQLLSGSAKKFNPPPGFKR